MTQSKAEGAAKDSKDVEDVVEIPESKLKDADKTAGPYVDDAEANDPPLRTNRPDVPIASSLATGAGAHKPNTDPSIGPDGRPVQDEG